MTKERPIIFSAPMVRAILDGSKTQTRRVLKGRPLRLWAASGWEIEDGDCLWCDAYGDYHSLTDFCPYGRIGDRLWVRETWAGKAVLNWQMEGFDQETVEIIGPNHMVYRASSPSQFVKKWRPSIFMPRWASRIQLEVVNRRVERLQDISEADAWAEGIPTGCANISIDTYAALWQKINGPGSWDLNPLVWVVEFKKINP